MAFDFSLGLKLFASNVHLYEPAQQLLTEGLFDYIELYAPPGSENFLPTWADGYTPYIIHGPHFICGVNWADITKRRANLEALATAQRYADTLQAPHIIIHGGAFGPIDEVVEQIQHVVATGETRLLLENTPKIAINGVGPATVYLPEHQSTVQSHVGADKLGLVLDIGHAIYAANACGCDHMAMLYDFLALKPAMFHLSDGQHDSQIDVHKNIATGDFDLHSLIATLPRNARITLETPKDLARDLSDTKADAERLRTLCGL